MKLINLIGYNLKRMLKNKISFVLTLILPTVVLFTLGYFINRVPSDSRTYYIVNNDEGIYGNMLISELSRDFSIDIYSKDEAMEKLKKKRIPEFYEIDKNFSGDLKKGQKPQLIVNRRETSNVFSDFEVKADDLAKGLMFAAMVKADSGQDVALSPMKNGGVKINVSTAKKTGMGTQMAINLLISFNLFCAIGMCYELFYLKNERTLRRSFTTANRPSLILGAILGAQFVMVFAAYTMLLLVYVALMDRTLLSQAPIIIFNLMMTTAVALSLSVFVSRIVKNDKLISVVLQIILCSTCFFGGSFVPVELLPGSITFISKFMPQYWALQSIKEGNYGYSLIVLLFAAVLFTAGTVSSRRFAEA